MKLRHVILFSLVSLIGCHGLDSYYVREYKDGTPGLAILEYHNLVIEVECIGTHYVDREAIVRGHCGWMPQHVGGHLKSGEAFSQITRIGDAIYYHDGMGSTEEWHIVKETAK